ncbi:MAG: permease-like cell division protein FtsX [Clostridia bacterium]|nr:permease-like cell division protein FtsX [Clostridia bacterium]
MIDRCLFLIKSAFRSIFNNKLLTLGSITVLTICLLTLGSSVLLFENINLFIDKVGDESQVVIFIDENLAQDEINQIHQQLLQIQNIQDVHFEPKERAMQNYLESMGENSELFSDISSDVLRNSFIFNIKDLAKFDQTMFEISKIEGIARIRERRDVIERIRDISRIVLLLAIAIITLLIIISAMIITNNVRTSVYARKEEIETMKYIGATDLFVQTPYLIEGIIIGVVAGLITLLLTFFVYNEIISPIIADFGLFTPIAIKGRIIQFALFYIVSGAIIGMIGSATPVKNYVNV